MDQGVYLQIINIEFPNDSKTAVIHVRLERHNEIRLAELSVDRQDALALVETWKQLRFQERSDGVV